ncbi:MAG: hypothetical protein R2795_01565 [Saprospiraceae bacterium]
MKTRILLGVIILSIWSVSTPLSAQTQHSERFRIGFQIGQSGLDFGLGLNMSIPIVREVVSLRLTASNHWLTYQQAETSVSTTYQIVRLGTAPMGWFVADRMRVYGEGGVSVLFPSAELSATRQTVGGYGVFGFECFVQEAYGSSLYFEIGGTSAGAQTSSTIEQPSFGAGLLINAGFRLAL